METIFNPKMALSLSIKSTETVRAKDMPEGRFGVIASEGRFLGHLVYRWPGTTLNLVTHDSVSDQERTRVRLFAFGDAFAVSVK